MPFLGRFGDKLGAAVRFGTKAIGAASQFGNKVARGLADGATWIARNSDKILSLAETAPGIGAAVRNFDGPIRAGINTVGQIGKLADMSADVLGGVASLTNRNRLEKAAPP